MNPNAVFAAAAGLPSPGAPLRRSSDKLLLWISLSLLCLGLAMVYSASMVVAQVEHGSTVYYFLKQSLFAAGGILLMLAAMRVHYRWLASPQFLMTALLLSLVSLLMVFYFPAANGAKRWIRLAGITLQPSEFVKIVLIIFTAAYISRKQEVINHWRKGLLPCLAVVGVFVILILKEPDLGTSTYILLSTAILLFVAGLSWTYLVGAVLLSLPMLYWLVFSVPYRRNRVLAFLDPLGDPLGVGYQIRQSLITVGSGGVWGAGMASGRQKLFFLPMPHTDFIYAVIGEELGLWGSLLVLALFVLFFWRGLRICVRAPDPFGRFLALGLTNMVALQALVNISVVLSLLPNKGLPLPFISLGGSSLMATLVGVGILLNISSHLRDRVEL